MKKHLLAIITLCLCALSGVQAQISSEGNWYNGTIIFSASHKDHNNVLLNAMDEGEEHEFMLRYVGEKNRIQTYTVAKTTNDAVMDFSQGTTARHQKSEGLDVICFYDGNNRLQAVMSMEQEWDAQKINEERWKSQMYGEYTTADGETTVNWDKYSLSINGEVAHYEVETFNGRVTGYITISPIEGSTNVLEGMWEVEPTLQGLTLHSVKTTGEYFYDRRRGNRRIVLKESAPLTGRFFYASQVLLNDKSFRKFDKATLRIMRNAIYARHGYRFDSQDLRDYFSRERWYHPAASNDGIRLSLLEQLNVDLIKYVEAQR
jgi:hypothetical protein